MVDGSVAPHVCQTWSTKLSDTELEMNTCWCPPGAPPARPSHLIPLLVPLKNLQRTPRAGLSPVFSATTVNASAALRRHMTHTCNVWPRSQTGISTHANPPQPLNHSRRQQFKQWMSWRWTNGTLLTGAGMVPRTITVTVQHVPLITRTPTERSFKAKRRQIRSACRNVYIRGNLRAKGRYLWPCPPQRHLRVRLPLPRVCAAATVATN